MDAERQAYEATIRQLRSLLAAQERLRKAAENLAREARGELERVAEGLCPEEVDRLRREGPDGLATLSPRQIADIVLRSVRVRLERWQAVAGLEPDDVSGLEERARAAEERASRAEAERATLEVEVAALRERLQAAEGTVSAQVETLNGLREQVRSLRQQLAEVREGRATPSDTGPAEGAAVAETAVQDEVQDEVKKNNVPSNALPPDDPAWAIVKAMGETGFCLRDDIAHAAGVGDAKWGTVREMFKRLRDAGLIEENRPSVESVGRTPYLVSLTEAGKAAFRERFGSEPAPSIFARLLARHKSVDHAWLNLQATQVLEERGYAVDLFPRDQVVDGGTFAPDLVAAKDGQVYYVECERDTRKDPVKRARKWEIYHRVTGGKFYIVVPNKATQSRILSEVGRWVYERGHPVTIHICTLALLRRQDEDVWTLQRELRVRAGVSA